MSNLRATIKDVASAAGVSTATVSRFLNCSGYVNDTTATRIRNAIDQTGYTPSLMARGLKTRHSRMLLLIVPDICNPFYSKMARQLQKLAQESDYILLLADSDESMSKELEALDLADKMNVEGVFFATINDNPETSTRLYSAPYHAVGLNAFPADTPFDSVVVHHLGGTNLAVNHLVELGHSHIAFAGGTPGSIISNSRRNGFLHAMQKHSLQIEADDIVEIGFAQEDGFEAGRQFAARKKLPTAICCANDLIALGVIRALNEAGLKVPDDVSVTGMDDIPYASISNPPLTTVSNDGGLFAEQAFKLMMEQIEGYKGKPRQAEIPNTLLVRASTCPRRKDSDFTRRPNDG